jgi:hypothetical protein
MTPWFDHVAAFAAHHGLSLPEFVVIDVIRTAFPMTETELLTISARFLPQTDTSVVNACLEKRWLAKSPDGMLDATPLGADIVGEIARQLHETARQDEQEEPLSAF